MRDIDISIIMPAWNSHTTLNRAIQSIIDQEYFKTLPVPQVELIIIDDCSDELTIALIQDWVKKISTPLTHNLSIVALRNLRNEGASVSRNIGIEASSGKFIAYLDSDDEFSPFRIAKSYLALTLDTSVDIILSPYRLVEGNISVEYHPERRKDFVAKEKEYLQKDNISIPLGVMHTREIFDKCVEKFGHGFPPGVVLGEDGILWRRMADLGARIFYTCYLAGTYYISKTGQSRTQRHPDSGIGYAFDKTHPGGSNGQYIDKIALEEKYEI